jgi:formate hydrogenlyase subunit 4
VALLGFALLALLGAAAAENALPPVEDPATPFETAMAQRALLLGASGRHLALWDYHAALRLTLWLGLLAALFLPFGTAPPGAGLLAWLGGLLAWVAKLAGLGAALAGLGSAAAVMRVSRVPEFLAAALLLGLLGAALLLLFVAPARVT